MPRLTTAQLVYGTLTVVVATTLLLVASGADSLLAVFGLTVIGLVLGAAVSAGVHRGQEFRIRHAAANYVRAAKLSEQREWEHSYSR
jgi:hypothetical protein